MLKTNSRFSESVKFKLIKIKENKNNSKLKTKNKKTQSNLAQSTNSKMTMN